MFESLSVDCRVHPGKDDGDVASFLIVSPVFKCVEGLRGDQQSKRLGKRIQVRRVGLHILVWLSYSWAKPGYILATQQLVEQIQHP
jgi:hypothetical protein